MEKLNNFVITLITINYNNAVGLQKTIESVVKQTENDFEYIVVDGASTDGSVEILKNQNSKLRYLSEPDTGIYNAMNKGIKMATGEFLLFINSGDELADDKVVESLQKSLFSDTEIASGGLTLISNKSSLLLLPPNEVSLSYCMRAGLTHPNTVIRKTLFEKYGLYNEQNKIVSDWEFFLIAAGLNSCNYQKLDFAVARFYEDGISSNNKELLSREMEDAIKRLVPMPIQKDVKRLHELENFHAQPAYILLHQSLCIKKLLTLVSKIRRKFLMPRR